ncbi:Zinc finger A20 and AN1 domain-containing stress-associated protein 3 [Sarcoptes scabiei]|uniref:Zinc finger A20 and AN1 domain-containing stress-associated protein 3 n=1 Tax=Sarcoptes scabiei TaxID=52283 RepID=A0A834R805_SARSC|nr:Zinc finger A20 and AN1 domain-containing stress-associated protein 3 [Sarcoptes scabiei]
MNDKDDNYRFIVKEKMHLCPKDCGFFGNEKFNGYCSVCWNTMNDPKSIIIDSNNDDDDHHLQANRIEKRLNENQNQTIVMNRNYPKRSFRRQHRIRSLQNRKSFHPNDICKLELRSPLKFSKPKSIKQIQLLTNDTSGNEREPISKSIFFNELIEMKNLASNLDDNHVVHVCDNDNLSNSTIKDCNCPMTATTTTATTLSNTIDGERKLEAIGAERNRKNPLESKLDVRFVLVAYRYSVTFECHCGRRFCIDHRLAEQHQCSFDYRTNGHLMLTKANPKIVRDKIEKI